MLQAFARLEAQFLREREPRVFVDAQGVRLSSGAIQREDELTAKALAESMLRDERLQLWDDVIVPTESEIDVDSRLHGAQPELAEPFDLTLSERVIGEVGQWRPVPKRKRLLQKRAGVLGIGRGECPSAIVYETLEAVRVHLTGRDLEDVPVRTRADDLVVRLASAELECLAQSREVHLNVLDGIRRRTLSPEDVDQPIDGNDLIPVQ
jgi:hypothetical protein